MYVFPIELSMNFVVILHKKGIQSGLTLSPLLLNFQKLHGESGLYIQCSKYLPILISMSVFSIDFFYFYEFLIEFAMMLHKKRHPIRSDLESARFELPKIAW
jgi:hypothetical protein